MEARHDGLDAANSYCGGGGGGGAGEVGFTEHTGHGTEGNGRSTWALPLTEKCSTSLDSTFDSEVRF